MTVGVGLPGYSYPYGYGWGCQCDLYPRYQPGPAYQRPPVRRPIAAPCKMAYAQCRKETSMPDESNRFRAGDVVAVRDSLHAHATQGVGIVGHTPENHFGYGLIPVRFTRPAYAHMTSYPASRLELLSRRGR